jgi:hypothetical protein
MKNIILLFLCMTLTYSASSQETKCECILNGETGIGGWTSVTGVNEQGEKKNYAFYAAYFPSQELCLPRDNNWEPKVKASILDAVASNVTLIQSQKSTSEDARWTKKSIQITGQANITQNEIDRLRQDFDYVIEVNAGLSSFASPLKKCSEISEEKSKGTQNSKSNSSNSKSSEKESKKVISKEEYDKYRVNISNYKFVQRIKELELKGYSSGQAGVLADWERDNRNNPAIVNDVGNALGSVLVSLIGNGSKRVNNKWEEYSGDKDFEKDADRVYKLNLEMINDINKKYSFRNIPEDPDEIKQFIMEYYLLMGNRSYYHYGAIVDQKVNNIYFEGDILYYDFELKVVQGIDDNNHLGGYSSRNYYTLTGTNKDYVRGDLQLIEMNLDVNHENFNKEGLNIGSLSGLYEIMPKVVDQFSSYQIGTSKLSILSLIQNPPLNVQSMYDKLALKSEKYDIQIDNENFNEYLEKETPILERLTNKNSEKIEPILIERLYIENMTGFNVELVYILNDKYVSLSLPINHSDGVDWMINENYKNKSTNATNAFYSITGTKEGGSSNNTENYYKPHSKAYYGIGGKSGYDIVMRENPNEAKEDVSVYTYATTFDLRRSTDLKFYKSGELNALHKLKSNKGYNYTALLSPKLEFGTFNPMIEYAYYNEFTTLLRELGVKDNKKFNRYYSIDKFALNLQPYSNKNEFAIIRLDKVNYYGTDDKTEKLYYNGFKKGKSTDKYLFTPKFIKSGFASLPLEGDTENRYNDISRDYRFLKKNISEALSISIDEFNEMRNLSHQLNDYYLDSEGYLIPFEIAKKLDQFINRDDKYPEVLEKIIE